MCDVVAMSTNLAGKLQIKHSQLAILLLSCGQCPCLIPPGQTLQQKALIMNITGRRAWDEPMVFL